MAETAKQDPQMPGGGDCNPDLRSNAASIQRFQNMRLGLSIHWSPSSLGGKEISWSRERDILKKQYDSYYKNFNPVHFDANEWVQLAADSGIKYISASNCSITLPKNSGEPVRVLRLHTLS